MLEFLDDLKEEWWIGYRKWWVDYLFHITDLNNVVSILDSGYVYSRDEVGSKEITFKDAASSNIVRQTRKGMTNYVRLYFRPLTPTAYHMEGFKPIHKQLHGAHCPVPVYLLFDMKAIVTDMQTQFSDGNLASLYSNVYSTVDEFTELDFQLIYNDRYDWTGKKYINARQAEVIYPNRLPLTHLKSIRCRSQAEYETLRTMLRQDDLEKWDDLITTEGSDQLFKKDWLFVVDASLNREIISLHLNLPTTAEFEGPFNLRVGIKPLGRSSNWCICEKTCTYDVNELPKGNLSIDVSDIKSIAYTVEVLVDTEPAYRNMLLDLKWLKE